MEAKEEARRFFDQERVKLLQEILELKSVKKQTDEALSNMIQSDKMKAGDLRSEHQQHQEQISKIKWDCEKDIRRLVPNTEYLKTNLDILLSPLAHCHLGFVSPPPQRPAKVQRYSWSMIDDEFIFKSRI